MNVISIFLLAAGIIFFGFFAEYFFKKYYVPDVFLLILFGLLIGRHGFSYITPGMIAPFAPLFTAFALLFIIFEGAFKIDLQTFVKEIGPGFSLTIFNYFISYFTITVLMLFFGFDIMLSMLVGFILGGVSSAFAIPVAQKLKIKKDTYTILTLESVITDVLCIIFAITIMELIFLQAVSIQAILKNLASLFAIAGFFGAMIGFIWINVINKFFRTHRFYMLTIAALLIVYTIVEFLGGNGAIASLFFGLVLQNSKRLCSIIHKRSCTVTTTTERFFYSQITFFLKTFFYVYIGILINFTDMRALIIAVIISVVILILRTGSWIFTKSLELYDRHAVMSVFGRGMASIVLAQLAIEKGIPGSETLMAIVVNVILITIFLSSVRVFILRKRHRSLAHMAEPEN